MKKVVKKKKRIDHVEEALQENKKMIDEFLASMDPSTSPEEKKLQEEALKKIFLEGEMPKDAMGFSKETIEFFYSYGYNLYNSGNYQDAEVIFVVLAQLDPENPKHVIALAAAAQMQGKTVYAIAQYATWAQLEPWLPLPFYYLGTLMEQIDKPLGAFLSYMKAVENCGTDKIFAPLKERALLNLKRIARKNPDNAFVPNCMELIEKLRGEEAAPIEEEESSQPEEDVKIALKPPDEKIELSPPSG